MITICLTYFRSLALANLSAALYSVRQQNLSRVEKIVIVDNNTDDSHQSIQEAIRSFEFPVPVHFVTDKHGDLLKTHSWSTNMAVRCAKTPWVLFTRADYILHFDLLDRFLAVIDSREEDWNGFVTANVYHIAVDVGECERLEWRMRGARVLRNLPGAEADYTRIDTGVWTATRKAFDTVGGLDERLTAWGHAQTHFQHKLSEIDTEFVRIPEALFYHPQHAAPRDLALAHQQLRDHGIDLHEMWARHEGPKVY